MDLNEYSLNDLSKHNKPNDCWILIKDKIYDVTNFLEDHPGGRKILLEYGGKNGTRYFNEIFHSNDAISQMKKYLVGKLEKKK